MKRIKNIFVFLILLLNFTKVYSQSYSNNQMLKAGHWIYDALSVLSTECGISTIADNAPLSINELKLNFERIEYDKLSESGKSLYNQAMDFFKKKNFTLNIFNPLEIGFNIYFNPVLMYKSNDQIPWSYANDYCGHKTTEYVSPGVTNEVDCNYAAASSFSFNPLTEKILTYPVYINFCDYAFIESDFCLSKNFFGMNESNNFCNIFFNASDFEFLWPTYAYFSAGYLFDNGLGINLHVGREGLEVGRTLTGSIIYNRTFQTDAFIQFNLFTKKLKFVTSIVEINNKKNLYMHDLEFAPFKWLRVGVLEGTMINGPFEIRYLNPLIIMHSFGSWNQYRNDWETKYYNEAHCCAYFGVNVDITPIKNLRLYAQYAMTEIQPEGELTTAYGRTLPDGFGFQAGAEYNLPVKNDSYINFQLEGIYTLPYLYVKQSDEWSLISERHNMQRNFYTPIYSWIGTPFGPDSLGGEFKIGYKKNNKWQVSLSYLFLAHGTNSFGMFSQKTKADYDDKTSERYDDVEVSAYYPSVLVNLGLITQEEAEAMARSHKLTGILQYTNQIGIDAEYKINKNCKLNTNLTYSFIFNNKNELNNFAQGFQGDLAFEYKLFE